MRCALSLSPCLVTFIGSPHQGGVSVGKIRRILEMDESRGFSCTLRASLLPVVIPRP